MAPPTDSVTIIATVTARPETCEELATLLAAQVGPTRAEPGCITYDLHVDPADSSTFVFYEVWRSQDDLDAHMGMAHLAPLRSQADRLLAQPVEIRHLTRLSPLA